VTSKNLPFLLHQELFASAGGVVCTVVGVEHKFASRRAMALIEKFGEISSRIHQKVEVITYVELATGNDLRFVVPIFPSETPNYLVPEALF